MLEPPTAHAKDVEKIISLEWKKTPETASFPHDLFQVMCGSPTVPLPGLANVDQEMPAAIDLELMNRRISGDDRRIH